MINWQFIAKKGYIYIPNKLECQVNCVEGYIDSLPHYIFFGEPPEPYLQSIRYKYYFRFTVDKKDSLACEKYLYNQCCIFNLITDEYVLQNCLVSQINTKTLIQFIGTCLDFKHIAGDDIHE